MYIHNMYIIYSDSNYIITCRYTHLVQMPCRIDPNPMGQVARNHACKCRNVLNWMVDRPSAAAIFSATWRGKISGSALDFSSLDLSVWICLFECIHRGISLFVVSKLFIIGAPCPISQNCICPDTEMVN